MTGHYVLSIYLLFLIGYTHCDVIFPGDSTGEKYTETKEIKADANSPQSRFLGLPNLLDACTYKCAKHGSKYDHHCCRKGYSSCCGHGVGHGSIPFGYGTNHNYGYGSNFGHHGYSGGNFGHHGGYVHGTYGNYGGYGGNYGGYGLTTPGLSYGLGQCPKQGIFGIGGLFRSGDSASGYGALPHKGGKHHKFRFRREAAEEKASGRSIDDAPSSRFLTHIPNLLCDHQCYKDADCYDYLGGIGKCCIDFYNCRKCINPYTYR